MEKTGLNAKLGDLLIKAKTTREEKDKASIVKKERREFLQMSNAFRTIGKTGDAKEILLAERQILIDELTHRSNDPVQAGSLETAIEGLDATEKLFDKVRDPDAYRLVDEEHSIRKRRSGGLPLDQARDFFKSHNARLLNLKKSTLTEEEKNLLDVRRSNIRNLGKDYQKLQRQALGIKEPAKSRGMSL